MVDVPKQVIEELSSSHEGGCALKAFIENMPFAERLSVLKQVSQSVPNVQLSDKVLRHPIDADLPLTMHQNHDRQLLLRKNGAMVYRDSTDSLTKENRITAYDQKGFPCNPR